MQSLRGLDLMWKKIYFVVLKSHTLSTRRIDWRLMIVDQILLSNFRLNRKLNEYIANYFLLSFNVIHFHGNCFVIPYSLENFYVNWSYIMTIDSTFQYLHFIDKENDLQVSFWCYLIFIFLQKYLILFQLITQNWN